MSKKDEFKLFVKNNPSLIKKVNSGTTTWQKLYELYDLFGEDNSVWNEYLSNNKSSTNIKDIINNIKGMNIDNIQKNVSSLQKAVEFLTDITKGTDTKDIASNFIERPINKFFDD